MNSVVSFIVVLCSLLVGCSDGIDTSKGLSDAEIASTNLLVKRSPLRANSQLVMSYSFFTPPQISQPLQLDLRFKLPPQQLLTLEYQISEKYQWLQQPPISKLSDQRGEVNVTLQLEPLSSGKVYIKFFASSLDEQYMQSFAIPLRVKNAAGVVPKIEKSKTKRINLPAEN
ncbi:MAG: hypothetical protein ACJAYG_001208 [Oceanicoccus sp.]|jgi:hypothetical protein